MHSERMHTCRLLLVFVVLWASLAVVAGALNKADVDFKPGAGSGGSAMEIALKMCAVIFTAVAAAAGVALHRLRRLPARRAGFEPRASEKPGYPQRPPPHGLSLLRALQIMLV